MRDLWECAGIIIVIALVILSLIVGMLWYISGREARVFNKAYGTEYTTGDFFWTYELIVDYIHEGEQKKINLEIK